MTDPPRLNSAIAQEFNKVETTLCLSTRVIVITEDRLELRVEDGMQKLSARDSWIAPFGIVLACLLTLFTADFKNFSWVSSGTLKGIFLSITIASVGWLAWSLLRMTRFGRPEFMSSIRTAGSQYNYSPGMLPGGDKTALAGQAAGQTGTQAGDVIGSPLQCRQCGSILLETIQGQVARCPKCGTVN